MTPHGPRSRRQSIRWSGAAGIHYERVARAEEERDAIIAELAAEPFECIECGAPCEPREGEDPVMITCNKHS